MHMRKTVAGIVLAGGTGSRFGGAMNKVYMPLRGMPVINYSINAMDAHPEVDEIIVVVRRGDEEQLDVSRVRKPCRVIYGGSTRRDSVRNGLEATRADYVVIHDGARPFLKSYYISDCLDALDSYPGATVAVRSKDTVKIAFENQLVMHTTNRMNTWIVQTPQCFRRQELLEAHERVADAEVTDDCMLLERLKKQVYLVPGDYTNIKITTRSDLGYAEYVVDGREHM